MVVSAYIGCKTGMKIRINGGKKLRIEVVDIVFSLFNVEYAMEV
jgi:hypothetical protein